MLLQVQDPVYLGDRLDFSHLSDETTDFTESLHILQIFV